MTKMACVLYCQRIKNKKRAAQQNTRDVQRSTSLASVRGRLELLKPILGKTEIAPLALPPFRTGLKNRTAVRSSTKQSDALATPKIITPNEPKVP
jgi:hypothetical protein